MIYIASNKNDSLRQGDIFIGIPKVAVSFANGLAVVLGGQSDQHEKNPYEKTPWMDIVKKGESTTAILSVIPVTAIVASQDCDASREEDITLCEIKPFTEFEKNYGQAKTVSKKIKVLTRQSCINLKWFYLPIGEEIEFKEPMGVDFLSTINVRRAEILEFINLRKCRLNDTARDHFKERLAHFYRRYAYNEWYPLNKAEMEAYAAEHNLKSSDWYPYQK